MSYLTVFRSKLRPGVREEYEEAAARMLELARAAPGFVALASFANEAGERVSLVEFASEESAVAWRGQPAHLDAQRLGRERFYASYRVQSATLDRDESFEA